MGPSTLAAVNSCSAVTLCRCSILSICFLLIPLVTFPPKFALASPPWKQARSNWNFNAMCRMITIRGRLIFRQSDLFYRSFYVHKRFSQRPPIRYSSKLSVALLLQARDAVTARHSQNVFCHAGESLSYMGYHWVNGDYLFLEREPSPLNTELLFIRNSRI